MGQSYYVYAGWVGGKEKDRAALQALGASVGGWNSDAETFDRVEIPASRMPEFERQWRGRYVYGLRRQVREFVVPRKEDEDEDIPF